jgi:hypothetical protein
MVYLFSEESLSPGWRQPLPREAQGITHRPSKETPRQGILKGDSGTRTRVATHCTSSFSTTVSASSATVPLV